MWPGRDKGHHIAVINQSLAELQRTCGRFGNFAKNMHFRLKNDIFILSKKNVFCDRMSFYW
jgi:hypothetical protein